MSNVKHLEVMLDTLRAIDKRTSEAYYEMGQILHAFKEGRAHEQLGYESFTHLVEEELSYSVGTAHRYANVFMHLKRLGYNKTESVKMINQFSITRLSQVLPDMGTKAGTRAVKNRIDALDIHQVNFMMSKVNYDWCRKILKEYGAHERSENRYLEGASEALLAILEEVSGEHKKAA